MGTPWKDALEVGRSSASKTALNEFVAYLRAGDAAAGQQRSHPPRSVIIATYALCGFANFSIIAIQIGGIGGLAPNAAATSAASGCYAMLAGTFASFMTACVVGVLL